MRSRALSVPMLKLGLTRPWDVTSGSKCIKMDNRNQLEIDAPFPSFFGFILVALFASKHQNVRV